MKVSDKNFYRITAMLVILVIGVLLGQILSSCNPRIEGVDLPTETKRFQDPVYDVTCWTFRGGAIGGGISCIPNQDLQLH